LRVTQRTRAAPLIRARHSMVTVAALDRLCIKATRIAVSQQRHNTQSACSRKFGLANNQKSFLVDALPGSRVMHRLLRLVTGRPSSIDPSRLTWVVAMIKACLWLAAGLVSALLVYWLHFRPVYEEDWTATIGSVVCAGLALYAAIGCINNLSEAVSSLSHRPVRR
jgi:hypothetical protein